MTTYRIEDFFKGWFVGDFENSVLRTSNFELALAERKRGQVDAQHFHKVATEWTVIISGAVRVHGRLFTEGDIFRIDPGEVSDPEILEDSRMIILKVPSVPGDKYII
jgi:hypothetical protein